MKYVRVLFPIMMLAALLLGACGVITATPTQDTGAIYTQAAQTAQAIITQQAFQTLVAQLTQVASPTATQVPPTATPEVIPPTSTPLPPTATPVPPTATPVPTPCDWAQYVKDVTYADGSLVFSGTKFVKTWRIKNIGTCTWDTNYALVYSSGSAMGNNKVVALSGRVKPGETVDLSVELTAPSEAGTYKGFWMLRNSSGKLFGIGSKADQAFWVQVVVSQYKSDPVPGTGLYSFDFTSQVCSAGWIGNDGKKVTVPCQNSPSSDLWVAVENNPVFENGRNEDERSLWFHLPKGKGLWMQGTYVEYEVKEGDHFVAWIGCLDGNDGCNATFSLDYQLKNGNVENLGSWRETYDEKITKLDIDLSALVGKKVKFILNVTNKSDSSAADVFWFVPSIRN